MTVGGGVLGLSRVGIGNRLVGETVVTKGSLSFTARTKGA